MKILYLDCSMGAAGDMLAAALWELLPRREEALRTLEAAGIPGVRFIAEKAERRGICGTHFRVLVNGQEERPGDMPAGHCHDHEHSHDHDHDHDHAHSHDHGHHHEHHSPAEIYGILDSLNIPQEVRADAKAVYGLISEAECQVHGAEAGHVHLHEVGAIDAVADVTAVSLFLNLLKPDRVLASPVHVGSGTVHCAHGIVPVPAPAAALLLRDIPIYAGSIRGELCTPTGAALLKHFVHDFAPMPPMRVRSIGSGMGTKDFEQANCLRAFWGDGEEAGDSVWELCCNLDDMTPEAVAFAQEALFDAGALDAYTVPVGMKKGRPGLQLCCMCRDEALEDVKRAFFLHTSTLGLRLRRTERVLLPRETGTVQTAHGPVRVKTARFEGLSRCKAEYGDLAALARKTGLPLEELRREAENSL